MAGDKYKISKGEKSLSPFPSSIFSLSPSLSLFLALFSRGQSCLCAWSLARFLPFCRGDATRRTRSMEQDGEEMKEDERNAPGLLIPCCTLRQTSYTPPWTVNFIFVDGTDG